GGLNSFYDYLTFIREEIREIKNGTANTSDNVLKNAPHTATIALSDTWDHAYAREKAVYPIAFVKTNKLWPSVRRIDSAYGDRNLICSCIPVEDYEQSEA